MIDEYTIEQLNKTRVADLSNYNEETHTFIIPKQHIIELVNGKEYIIEINPALLVYNINSILIVNWNKNTTPPTNFLKIKVGKILSDMIYVESKGYDIQNNKEMEVAWNGWIPSNELKILSELN